MLAMKADRHVQRRAMMDVQESKELHRPMKTTHASRSI